MPWLRRGRPAWAVPVLLFLAVLIAAALAFNLANLEAGEERAPALPAGTSPGSLLPLDPVYVDVLTVGSAGTALAAIIYLFVANRPRGRRRGKRSSWWEIVSSILGVAIMIALILAWPRALRTFRSDNATANSSVGTPGAGGVADWPASVGAPIGMLLIVAVLLTIVMVTYLLRRNAAFFDRAEESIGPRADRKQAAEAVQATITELEIGADVRTAILACFQRFCHLLGARGITEQEAFTPRELERVAVDRLRVSADASKTLTSLFEEARYSEHALREADRARAIDSLAGIRAALEA